MYNENTGTQNFNMATVEHEGRALLSLVFHGTAQFVEPFVQV